MMPPGPHRLANGSGSKEPEELLKAIKRQLPRQLPALDEHTLAKLKASDPDAVSGERCRQIGMRWRE